MTQCLNKTTMTRLTILALSFVGLSCFKQTVLCPPLDSCGGGGALPVGDWTLDGNQPPSAACSEDLYTPPDDPRLATADQTAARVPPIQPALYDWCDLLVTTPNIPIASANDPTPKPTTNNSIVGRLPNFSYTTFPIGAATIHYDGSNKYVLSTTRTGRYALDFPAYCVREFGAVGTTRDPSALPATTGSICEKLQDALTAIAPPIYMNIGCQPGPSDLNGCVCGFDVADREVSSGAVGVNPNDPSEMTHLPGNDFPEDVTYCVQGNRLELTGTNGAYLFDRVGLRTLDMVKVTVNCTDGVRGPGEDGVDCGPACPMLCP
jgi:hypothetical protein